MTIDKSYYITIHTKQKTVTLTQNIKCWLTLSIAMATVYHTLPTSHHVSILLFLWSLITRPGLDHVTLTPEIKICLQWHHYIQQLHNAIFINEGRNRRTVIESYGHSTTTTEQRYLITRIFLSEKISVKLSISSTVSLFACTSERNNGEFSLIIWAEQELYLQVRWQQWLFSSSMLLLAKSSKWCSV